MFTGNNGSAIVLRSSVLVASGNYTFTYNKADSGGALKILFQSAVSTCSPLPVKYCSIWNIVFHYQVPLVIFSCFLG